MKNKKLALLLPLLPLLMANSPAPRIYAERYEDFESSYVGEETIDNYRYQVFNIKNTGKGYISSFYADGKLDYEFSASARENDFYPLFENTVIGPNQNTNIKIKANTPLVAIDKNQLEYRTYAYSYFFEDAIVSGSKDVELLKQNDDYCYYSIDVQVENVPANERNSIIFKATYDGDELYLKVDSDAKYRFYTTEALDLTKFDIGNPVSVLKKTDDSYNYDEAFEAIGAFFLRLLIVFVVIIFLIGGIIFLTIFLPKIIRKKNQRKRELQKKEYEEKHKGE